ncbi:hypothetical protein [Sphingomonas phyllosphaerae]|uniref:hypothetical protein n=1 Tax=Sphingomonas phyllosphaerae TaxID=257003 RepID=UPI0024139B56|nr:hypothetical protein [Sphingomonas phyllosphaerae]
MGKLLAIGPALAGGGLRVDGGDLARHGALDREAAHEVGPLRHAEQSWRLRHRYLAASTILSHAHVAVQANRADHYVSSRREWEPAAERVASAFGYAMSKVGGSLPAEGKSGQA